MLRSSAFVLALTATFLGVFVPEARAIDRPRPVVVDANAELRFLNRINLERAARGLPALIRDERLGALARFHSADMALRGFVGLISPEDGSIVERAADKGRVGVLDVTAQVASGSDLGAAGAPLLDASVSRVGVGIVVRGDRLWLTQLAVAAGDGGGYAPVDAPRSVQAALPFLMENLRASFELLRFTPLRLARVWR